jgi:voltage-gated sodium channel
VKQYIVTSSGGLIIREGPGPKSKRTAKALHHGEIFEVDDIVTLGAKMKHWQSRPSEEVCYLRLKGAQGWVVDKNIITEENLVEEHNPNMSGLEKCRYTLRQFFQSKTYEYMIMTIIMINAFTIGLEIDHAGIMAHHHWLIMNTFFAVIYVGEMIIKLFAFGGPEFFRSYWNIFDVVVTVVTLVGDVYMVYKEYSTHGHGQDSGFLALIPVLRLLRLLRIAKLFHELRLLVKSFVGSLSALAWIAVFTILWFYICACVGTVFLGRADMLKDGEVRNAASLRAKFATIPLSMYTLFEVMTLEAFGTVAGPLVKHRPLLVLFFLVFVFVTAFFLLNLVTAVVVDRTMLAQKESEEAQGNVEEDVREAQIADMYSAFMKQNNGQDMISEEKYRRFQKHPQVQEAMANLDWNEEFLTSMLIMIDHNKAGEVSLKELQDLWIMYGQPLDTATLLHCQMQLARRLEMTETLCTKLLEKLEAGSSTGLRR